MAFALVFLMTYAVGAVLLLNGGQANNGLTYAALTKALAPKAEVGLALLFLGAPFVGMIVGGSIAAKSAMRDQMEGRLDPRRFFFSFFIGFATAWFIVFPLGLRFIYGPPKMEEVLLLIGGVNMFILGGVIPAVSLWLGTKAQTALARSQR